MAAPASAFDANAVSEALQKTSGQTGTIIIDSKGGIVKSSGDLEGSQKHADLIFKLLQDTVGVLQGEALKRMTVSFKSYQYSITLANNMVYAVRSALPAE